MADYWITPHGTYTELYTHFKDQDMESCRDEGIGMHTFWHGTFLGKRVALQGGIFNGSAGHPGYDIFSFSANDEILYWGTFRGNKFNDGQGNAFSEPVVWMNPNMRLGESVSGMTEDHAMSNRLRAVTSQGPWYYSLTVEEHFDEWINIENDPYETPWYDVLRVTYRFGNSPEPSKQYKEDYWLAKGLGTIAFKSHNPDEPSCVDYQYALWPPKSYDPKSPLVPWYDPFYWRTFVPNGFFEHHIIEPSSAGPLSNYEYSWTGWSGSPGFGNKDSEDVTISDSPFNPDTGKWKVALRVSPSEGWDMAMTDPIRVLSYSTYRLSGWLYRTSPADDVYLDMDDLTLDDNIYATVTGKWQHVQGDINVGAATTIQVRCVRNNGNTGDAFCDGIALQRIETVDPGEPPPPGPGPSPGGTCPNGICERGEKFVRLLEDGTTVRETTCPEDCPSCGILGGDLCSQTTWCPEGYISLGNTYDCIPCCESCESTGCPPESCGWQTDNCDEEIWCGDCLPSCGSMGGDYCSQTNSCPQGYDALGPSSDCQTCCSKGPSCGQLGGDYCSQSGRCPAGGESLGVTYDCRPCCNQ
jgi:hypothetical protein